MLLNNPGSAFFFAFGAGHFVGDHTIIDVVRRAGFRVDPVTEADDLDNWSRTHPDTNGNVDMSSNYAIFQTLNLFQRGLIFPSPVEQ